MHVHALVLSSACDDFMITDVCILYNYRNVNVYIYIYSAGHTFRTSFGKNVTRFTLETNPTLRIFGKPTLRTPENL